MNLDNFAIKQAYCLNNERLIKQKLSDIKTSNELDYHFLWPFCSEEVSCQQA
jgi:hypothetical protein